MAATRAEAVTMEMVDLAEDEEGGGERGQEEEVEFVDGLEDVRFHSYVRTMQKIILFETKTVSVLLR